MSSFRLKAFTLAAALVSMAASAPAAVLITEAMADPSGTDADREWIEIYNNGAEAVDLSNYKIGDEEASPLSGPGTEGMYFFPSGAVIQAGQVAIITQKVTGFRSLYASRGAAFLDSLLIFEINETDGVSTNNLTKYTAWATGNLALGNDFDQVVLLDQDDTIIDRVNLNGTATQYAGLGNVPANGSLERVPADIDTNTVADFVVRTAGNATPGVVTLSAVPEPTSLSFLGAGGLALLARRRSR
jgi:hypothetical protein